MSEHETFDPLSWACPCGGASDVYVVNDAKGKPQYHVMECPNCGTWRRHVPELGEQEIGKELPEELAKALAERAEKIRQAPPRLEAVGPASLPDSGPLPPLDALPGMDSIPPIPDDPMMMEQGTIMDCGYCGKIYPDLKGAGCPKCNDSGPTFRPARMMDRRTSLMEILPRIFDMYVPEKELHETNDPSPELISQYRDRLISLVETVGLYQFNIKDALMGRIYELDMEFDIDPATGCKRDDGSARR
jgi:hypothetical protein